MPPKTHSPSGALAQRTSVARFRDCALRFMFCLRQFTPLIVRVHAWCRIAPLVVLACLLLLHFASPPHSPSGALAQRTSVARSRDCALRFTFCLRQFIPLIVRVHAWCRIAPLVVLACLLLLHFASPPHSPSGALEEGIHFIILFCSVVQINSFACPLAH